MPVSNTILSLTTDLLAHNAFSHLPDEEIAALHHLILRLTEPLTPVQQSLLLGFWSHACAAALPAPLLHRCNAILLRYGRRPMEMLQMELECY